MSNSAIEFESEYQITVKPVIVIIVIVAIAITILADAQDPITYWASWGRLVVLLYATALSTWMLDLIKPIASHWFAMIALSILIHLSAQWVAMPGILNLIVIPIALATPLLRFPITLMMGITETLILLIARPYIAPGMALQDSYLLIAGIWGILGILYAIYQPRRQLNSWLQDHFAHTQKALEEARDQKAQLKQALSDLAHANRQQALTNERLTTLRRIAEEAQKTKAAFVAKVSHEFRTPLNMILGLVNLMVDSPEVYEHELPPSILHDLGIVYRNCEHLSSMVNDVLALSQAESGRMALHRERVNLQEVIEGAINVVRPLLDKKDLDAQVIMPPDLPQAYCDRTRIRQVILNLISNAVRYTEQGGITIRATQQTSYVVIHVSDTGLGIPPEDAEHIFEPFCQGASKLWRDKRGSGLGLSVSKQFVELHGGRIWFESEPGVGTTFSFDLPISPPISSETNPTRWLREDWEWVKRSSSFVLPDSHYRSRIIVCDETGEIYPLMTRYSDQVEWVDTQNLPQVRQELEQCPAHAVILNTPTPQHLWPLVEQAKKQLQETPIIGCSMLTQLKYASKSYPLEYLIKPVTRTELQKAIDQMGLSLRQVLIVDDDPDVLQLLTRMLYVCDNSLEVITALNGKQGLELMRTRQPDLVLLDVVMPELDGWQVLEIKEQEETINAIPVILVSAQDPSEQPLESEVLVVTMSEGLSFNKTLACSLELASLLLKPG